MSGRSRRTAAMVARPSVPAPMTTAERAPSRLRGGAARAPCTAQAVGSTMTAASSLHPAGHLVQLQVVGDQRQRPAAAGVGAVTRLQAGLQVAADQSLAVVGAPGRAGRQGGSMPRTRQCRTGSITTRRPSSASRDHLVAGHEGEAHDGLEPPRRPPVHGGQVAPADPRQAGPDHLPLRPGQAPAGRCRPAGAGRPGRRRPASNPTPPGRPRTGPRERSICRAFIGAPARAGARSAAGDAAPPGPSASAPRASRVCGRWRPAWSRG